MIHLLSQYKKRQNLMMSVFCLKTLIFARFWLSRATHRASISPMGKMKIRAGGLGFAPASKEHN